MTKIKVSLYDYGKKQEFERYTIKVSIPKLVDKDHYAICTTFDEYKDTVFLRQHIMLERNHGRIYYLGRKISPDDLKGYGKKWVKAVIKTANKGDFDKVMDLI